MKTKEFSIIQISPANGFSAVFANEDATVFTRPVACWALTRRVLLLEEGDWDHLEKMEFNLPAKNELERGKPIEFTRVEGEVCNGSRELEPCESDDYFLGYIGPGENPLDFQERARDLVDVFDDEDDEDDEPFNEDIEADDDSLTDGLPQALSHLSVQVQESIREGKMPPKWEQGGWLEFMKHFGDLSGG
jgi:hypothetical protein